MLGQLHLVAEANSPLGILQREEEEEEEAKGESEGSRSGDSDISGAFGATYLHRISQLPRHFLKRVTHYQAKKIQGTSVEIFHLSGSEEMNKYDAHI